MDKRKIIAQLNKICEELDNSRHYEESAMLTNIMRKIAVKDTHEDPTGEGTQDSTDYKPKQNIVPCKFGMIAPLKKIHSLGLLNEKGHKYYTSVVGEGNTEHKTVTNGTMLKVLRKLQHWGMLNQNGINKIQEMSN